jgi:hypothetical protein
VREHNTTVSTVFFFAFKRFGDLRKKKTVETVPLTFWPVNTGLKPGVNERSDFWGKAADVRSAD